MCSRPHSSELVFGVESKLLPWAHRPRRLRASRLPSSPSQGTPLILPPFRSPDCPSYGCALVLGLLLAFPLHSVHLKPAAPQGLAQFHLLFGPLAGPPSPNAVYPKRFQPMPGFFSLCRSSAFPKARCGRCELSRRTNLGGWLRPSSPNDIFS